MARGAADVAVGFAKGAGNRIADLGEMAGHFTSPFNPGAGNLAGAVDEFYGKKGLSDSAFAAARERFVPTNTAQKVGSGLETVAEMAIPVTKGAAAVKAAIPSAARAGAKFAEVAAAANKIPVDLAAPGDVALRIADLAQRGGGTNFGPAPVRQFLQWVTDPKKAPMTYEVAKDFGSNISRLSANEYAKLPPAIAREVAALRVTLNKSIADAAGKAGKAKEFVEAMTEYRRAKRLEEAVHSAWLQAKKAGPWVAGAGALGWMTKQVASMLPD